MRNIHIKYVYEDALQIEQYPILFDAIYVFYQVRTMCSVLNSTVQSRGRNQDTYGSGCNVLSVPPTPSAKCCRETR